LRHFFDHPSNVMEISETTFWKQKHLSMCTHMQF
jgi:hypothetical protein